MSYATVLGFKASAVVALADIFIVKRIKDRRAQIARCPTCTCSHTCTCTCTCTQGWIRFNFFLPVTQRLFWVFEP